MAGSGHSVAVMQQRATLLGGRGRTENRQLPEEVATEGR
jgi:hypothetical protein